MINMIVVLLGDRPHLCLYEGEQKTVQAAAAETMSDINYIRTNHPHQFMSFLYKHRDHRLLVRVDSIEYIQFGTPPEDEDNVISIELLQA